MNSRPRRQPVNVARVLAEAAAQIAEQNAALRDATGGSPELARTFESTCALSITTPARVTSNVARHFNRA